MVTELDVKRYIVGSLITFGDDPPKTRYEAGYQAALRTILLDVWGTPEDRGLDARGMLDWNKYLAT